MDKTITAAAWYVAKMLRTVREKIQVERRYTVEELTDTIAALIDGQFSEPLNARFTAETHDGQIMLMVYPYDEELGEPSPKGQTCTITVTDGFAMKIYRSGKDDDPVNTSWGERF